MTYYSVFSKQAEDANFEYEHCFFSVSPAKKEIKRLWAAGFMDAGGSKTKVWSNGEWEPCGPIEMKGSNKVFIANSRMTKPNY